MAKITYPTTSPYASTAQSSWAIEPMAFRAIPPDSGDQQVTLTLRHQHRPDRLSFDLYNTPAYWWVFSVRNPFLRRDPIWSFVTGVSIYAPSADYLRRILG